MSQAYISAISSRALTSTVVSAIDQDGETANQDRLFKGCVHQLFEARVEETPDWVAVISPEKTLTYIELNQRANQLARHLQALGVGPEGLVGVCLDRSSEMIVALLAILKAGGAYVPLDPDYPTERLNFILQDTQIKWVVTTRHFCNRLPTAAFQSICIDQDWSTIVKQPSKNLSIALSPQNLMYVIYTSGSTGQPKGVMIPHSGIVNQLTWRQISFPLASTDRVLQNISFSFDPSVWQIFWPLTCGAQLLLPRPGGHKDVSYLVDLIAQQQVSVIAIVPSMLNVLLKQPDLAKLRCLRHIFCGGEALSQSLLREFFQQFKKGQQLHNVYGPTEASIDAACWTCQPNWTEGIVPIGYPILNAQLYILDETRNLVKPGEVGELFIGGEGLARGYLNRPDLTAERFVSNPFSSTRTDRLYRTGDLVKMLPGGEMAFIGRIDQQVKIRGFRIELGEIEQVLQRSPDVADCAIAVQTDQSGRQQIVAYVVFNSPNQSDTQRLRIYLASRLPDYMVPSLWITLPQLPLNPNGKLDRQALPAPDFPSATDAAPPLVSSCPEQVFRHCFDQLIAALPEDREKLLRTYLQHRIARALNLREKKLPAVDQNLLDLGIDSLMIMQIVAQLKQDLQLVIPVQELFDRPCIDDFAKYLATEFSRIQSLSADSLATTIKSTSLTVLRDIICEKLDELVAKLNYIDQQLLINFPIGQHCTRFKVLPPTQPFMQIPENLKQEIEHIQQKYGQETVALYQKAILAFLMRDSLSTFQDKSFTLEVRDSCRSYFESVFRDFDKQNSSFYAYSNDFFLKDLNVCSLRLFPIGETLVQLSEISRRSFLGIKTHGSLLRQGSLGKFFELIHFYLTKIKGEMIFYELHIDTRRLNNFNPEGMRKLYIQIADMLKLNPHIQGIHGTSWFNDPFLKQISPELLYLREIPEQGGAKIFKIATFPEDILRATAVSAKRRKLYEEGKYKPTSYALIWLRDDLIRWAKQA